VDLAGSSQPHAQTDDGRRLTEHPPVDTKPSSGTQDRARAWALAGALTGIVVAADQAAKQLVVSNLRPHETLDVALGFQIANVRNDGVAFGLLAGGEALVLGLTLGALALLFAYFAFDARRPGLWGAVGLVAGGAVGNLADRVRTGFVIDFIDPPFWPAFNLADVAIVLGVAVLVLVHRPPQRAHGLPH
jgi:signal peptidase II